MRERQNKRILQSRDIKIEGMVQEARPVTKGPVTGELTLTAAQWLERNATAGELEAFKASVQARLERGAATAWRVLPGGSKIKGDSILATCSNCRRWAWTSPGHENDPCLSCNFRALKGGGIMRAATKAEVQGWHIREEARLAKLKADAPKRKAELDAFNRRVREDAGRER